ncbi:MAG: DUF1275 domain-containing protein [Pseudobutyrivibrio sp.]|nr:DUF1275 domain-containing protein [Pseudobutyrivibrio sp.]
MKKQISDSVSCGVLLALSGGSMDAYSYLFRGHVFANAQTGNMLLFGVNLAAGDFITATNYLWPVLAFTAGIILSDIINTRKSNLIMHWRQISVLIEAIILTVIAFLPDSANAVCNASISFACGIQVESFRTIRGNSIATTMCIGNLRSGTYNLDKYLGTKETLYLKKSLLYYGVIISFVIGAIIESGLIAVFGSYAIMLSSALLLIAFVFMFKTNQEFN